MKIYLAGKITGLNIEVARRNFESAAKHLKKDEYLDVTYGILVNACQKCSKDINGEWWNCNHCENTGVRKDTWLNYMKRDVAEMLTCDVVYLLPNWQDSRGAQIERDLALRLGIEVRLYGHSDLPLTGANANQA